MWPFCRNAPNATNILIAMLNTGIHLFPFEQSLLQLTDIIGCNKVMCMVLYVPCFLWLLHSVCSGLLCVISQVFKFHQLQKHCYVIDCVVTKSVLWTEIKASRSFFSNGEYPQVIFELWLRRKPTYYVINIIVPCVLISFIAAATFILPPNCVERLGLSTYQSISFVSVFTSCEKKYEQHF